MTENTATFNGCAGCALVLLGGTMFPYLIYDSALSPRARSANELFSLREQRDHLNRLREIQDLKAYIRDHTLEKE